MKHIYIYILILLSIHTVSSQVVGIKTINPVTNLHLVGDQYTEGITKIGGAVSFTTSAQLELGDNNKGFLPNRVTLTDYEIKAPVANAANATLVYNTGANSAIKYGYLFWSESESQWRHLYSEVPSMPTTDYNLLEKTTSIPTSPSESENGAYLPFGDIVDSSTGNTYFKIPRSGSYAFAIRVYGEAFIPTGRSVGRACVYFTLMINGVKTDVQEYNWSLVSQTISGANSMIGGTVLLVGGDLKKGDRVQFVLANYDTSFNPATNFSMPVILYFQEGIVANRTSLTYWKI